MSSPMSEFLSAIVVIIVLWFGGQLILGGNSSISAADFVSYIVVFSQIISPAKSFSQGSLRASSTTQLSLVPP